jgi:hypothetical protein
MMGRVRANRMLSLQSKKPTGQIVYRPEKGVMYFPSSGHEALLVFGKMPVCRVKGCRMAHNALLHDVLEDEEVMKVSASLHTSGKKSYGLRCQQKIAVEHADQCFRFAALYNWGATTL